MPLSASVPHSLEMDQDPPQNIQIAMNAVGCATIAVVCAEKEKARSPVQMPPAETPNMAQELPNVSRAQILQSRRMRPLQGAIAALNVAVEKVQMRAESIVINLVCRSALTEDENDRVPPIVVVHKERKSVIHVVN